MEPQPSMPPPPSTDERCYRHPDVPTGVHCTRCNRPICTECMVPAPVGHHCPTCVAEARKEYRQGPGRRIAVANAKALSVTTALLVIIAAVYVIEVIAGGAGSLIEGPNANVLVRLGAAVAVWPVRGGGIVGIAAGQSWRLFTSMFLHAGILHIGFNAYALYVFGTMVEQDLGRGRYLLLYLVTGVAASAVSYALVTFAVQPGGQIVLPPPAVGASGAIFGVFGAFIAFNWRRRHQPAAAARLRMAVILIVINAVIGFTPGIDWHAHAGGLVAGLVAGFAAEGFGNRRNEKAIFAVTCVALVAVTVALVVWKTAQIHTQFPQSF